MQKIRWFLSKQTLQSPPWGAAIAEWIRQLKVRGSNTDPKQDGTAIMALKDWLSQQSQVYWVQFLCNINIANSLFILVDSASPPKWSCLNLVFSFLSERRRQLFIYQPKMDIMMMPKFFTKFFTFKDMAKLGAYIALGLKTKRSLKQNELGWGIGLLVAILMSNFTWLLKRELLLFKFLIIHN